MLYLHPLTSNRCPSAPSTVAREICAGKLNEIRRVVNASDVVQQVSALRIKQAGCGD